MVGIFWIDKPTIIDEIKIAVVNADEIKDPAVEAFNVKLGREILCLIRYPRFHEFAALMDARYKVEKVDPTVTVAMKINNIWSSLNKRMIILFKNGKVVGLAPHKIIS